MSATHLPSRNRECPWLLASQLCQWRTPKRTCTRASDMLNFLRH